MLVLKANGSGGDNWSRYRTLCEVKRGPEHCSRETCRWPTHTIKVLDTGSKILAAESVKLTHGAYHNQRVIGELFREMP